MRPSVVGVLIALVIMFVGSGRLQAIIRAAGA